MGVGNIEQGGVAGGYGCWMHENDIKGGDELYLPDELRWCGDAPHHQVRLASLPPPFRSYVESMRADEYHLGRITPRV